MPEVELEPLQPCLALLRRPGEALGGHLVGYDGEDVSGSVRHPQLLLQRVFPPRVDEEQRLRVCPGNAPSPC